MKKYAPSFLFSLKNKANQIYIMLCVSIIGPQRRLTRLPPAEITRTSGSTRDVSLKEGLPRPLPLLPNIFTPSTTTARPNMCKSGSTFLRVEELLQGTSRRRSLVSCTLSYRLASFPFLAGQTCRHLISVYCGTATWEHSDEENAVHTLRLSVPCSALQAHVRTASFSFIRGPLLRAVPIKCSLCEVPNIKYRSLLKSPCKAKLTKSVSPYVMVEPK